MIRLARAFLTRYSVTMQKIKSLILLPIVGWPVIGLSAGLATIWAYYLFMILVEQPGPETRADLDYAAPAAYALGGIVGGFVGLLVGIIATAVRAYQKFGDGKRGNGSQKPLC